MASRTETRAPTPQDVELARVAHRYLILRYVIVVVGTALTIAVLWIPLQPVREMVESLSGKDTRVSVALSFVVTLSVVLGGTAFLYWYRYRSLRDETARLRERIKSLEQDILKAGDGE